MIILQKEYFFTRRKCFCFRKLIFKSKNFENRNNNIGTHKGLQCQRYLIVSKIFLINHYDIFMACCWSAATTIDGSICKTYKTQVLSTVCPKKNVVQWKNSHNYLQTHPKCKSWGCFGKFRIFATSWALRFSKLKKK